MMVPRSYQYSGPTPMKYSSPNEKPTTKVSNTERKPTKLGAKKDEIRKPMAPKKMLTPSPPTPSKPVVIPTRSRDNGRRRSRESGSKDAKETTSSKHDPSSTPPSMAALLAMTTLPEPGYKRRSNVQRDALSPPSQKYYDTGIKGQPRRSISSSSPQSWSMLLTPPEESQQESSSVGSDTTLGPLSSVRSLSTESMPSLDEDTGSLSSVGNPETPGLFSASRTSSGRQKSLSTSVGEDCATDHPLLAKRPRTAIKSNDIASSTSTPPSLPPPNSSRSSSFFKSNLTASLRRIRSAAQSFSAFTAPPSQSEDYLARSLLSINPTFTDERRPLTGPNETPDPALRRYLNPPTKTPTFSPAEFHFHSSSSESAPQVTNSPCSASIQLQTYRRRKPHDNNYDKGSQPPIFTSAQQKAIDAVDGFPAESGGSRQREPRENSDFLRVIVLEMNMRRGGKLGSGEVGRARLWLPARQVGKGVENQENIDARLKKGGSRKIPSRWEGTVA